MISAYLKTKKRNVILLDWENEAKSGVLGIPLGYALYAVRNAKQVPLNILELSSWDSGTLKVGALKNEEVLEPTHSLKSFAMTFSCT